MRVSGETVCKLVSLSIPAARQRPAPWRRDGARCRLAGSSMGSGEHRFTLAEILSHSYAVQEQDGGHKSLEELAKSLGSEQESEMPLEELLALYGYEASDPISEQGSEAHELSTALPDMTLDKEQIAKDLLSGEEEEETQSSADDLTPSVTSHASDLFPRHLEAHSPTGEDKDSCSSDSDSGSEDGSIPPNDCRKDIMVGPQYQAAIPALNAYRFQDRAYENEDQLLWDPWVLSESDVEQFLLRAERRGGEEDRGTAEPGTPGAIIKDNEQALYELVKCSFDAEEALRRLRFNVKVFREELCAWSEEECRNFEHGYRVHGKNFHLIQANKVRTRSVGECVEYYYMWKKSDRHEFFTQQTSRFGRKRFSLQPGNMDDAEQDGEGVEGDGSSHARSSPPEPSATAQLGPPSPQDPLELGKEGPAAPGGVEEMLHGAAGDGDTGGLLCSQLGASPPERPSTNCPSPPGCPEPPRAPAAQQEAPASPCLPCASPAVRPELLAPAYYQLQLGPFVTDTGEPSPEHSTKRLKVGFSLPEAFPGGLPLLPSAAAARVEPPAPPAPGVITSATPGQVSVSVTTEFGAISMGDVSSFLSPHAMRPPAAVQHSQSLSQ
ncbi:mesoderm induction early response protein 2 isoform X2 [Lepisosteus oculatus]|uniref:mesoderm induction early response protein 2 isoform X2 n=1 Tax=Lepisosteus oculatus TaxID=7918 RepID=UPI000740100F|nr:PREDICTED: mesoderm induction early response protein 2 isoform X2 [Lepisosteus oculatus]